MRVEYSKGQRASEELIRLHRETSFDSSNRRIKGAVQSGCWTRPL